MKDERGRTLRVRGLLSSFNVDSGIAARPQVRYNQIRVSEFLSWSTSSMLPAFNDDGLLPPGIHRCTIDELVAQFGSGSDERVAQIEELLNFIESARTAGVRRLLVNGSFVTGKLSPNDVDVVILPGVSYPRLGPRLESTELIWPYLQIIVALDDEDFEDWALNQFAMDRRDRPKGVVEVQL